MCLQNSTYNDGSYDIIQRNEDKATASGHTMDAGVENLHTAWASKEIASMWYIVVHDRVPTNERLHVIRLVQSDRCRHCGRRDTLIHRLTECNEGTAIWLWTRERVAQMLRTDPRRIPADLCLRPHFQFWPPQRHKAILWLLAHLIMYRISSNDSYHCSAVLTSCAARNGSHTGRPAGCSG